jgi:hypothetical protein
MTPREALLHGIPYQLRLAPYVIWEALDGALSLEFSWFLGF